MDNGHMESMTCFMIHILFSLCANGLFVAHAQKLMKIAPRAYFYWIARFNRRHLGGWRALQI
jgi:hypothetical protein